ncbi:hypothetical protein, conserved [Babesia bigemina]|uniref:Ribosomal silencing factor RsfS n=1 Tax=Babesia bigemina TaxID=5866 RepID=A0A061DEJ7_BABBI|nr:hypothetical protein, conserved [Babesia bigemina]CDR97400.1 hypothetical protein, conserved [Babesia bigemina]|eukprot:XP_012769586.1 hypothetical protein, conserved [Babesia bigemina]
MYVLRLFGPLLRQHRRPLGYTALVPLCRAVDAGGRQSRRHFTTDDTTDRFRHVSESLPHRQSAHEGPEYTGQSTGQWSDESPGAPSAPSERGEKPKLDKAAIKSIPLETIEDAVLKFVPETIRESSLDDDFLTPGQAFYLENRDKLFDQLRRRYFEATSEGGGDQVTDGEIESMLPLLMEEEQFGCYDPEPVVSPGKHHLWDYNTSEVSAPRRNVHLRKGEMPTLQQVVEILEQERMSNVVVVDMDSCNRRDQAMYCIVATGMTKAHCRRVGRLIYRAIVDLEVPFVSRTAYCCHSRNDEWIVARLGPLCVHLLVKEVRERQSIEDLWAESRAADTDHVAGSITEPENSPADHTTHKLA